MINGKNFLPMSIQRVNDEEEFIPTELKQLYANLIVSGDSSFLRSMVLVFHDCNCCLRNSYASTILATSLDFHEWLLSNTLFLFLSLSRLKCTILPM